MDKAKLEIVPINFDEAASFVNSVHRHHPAPQGHKFSLAVSDGSIRGVAIVGRPVSRMEDDGWTLEVVRLATDGTPNACSKLYRAAWRVALNLGFKRLITYTLKEENGASLRASGFTLLGSTKGGSWRRSNRPRIDKHPLQAKWKWAIQT